MAYLHVFTAAPGHPTLNLRVAEDRVDTYRQLLIDKAQRGGSVTIEATDDTWPAPRTYYVVPSNVAAWTFVPE